VAEVSLQQVSLLIWGFRRTLVVAMLGGLVAGFAWYASTPPTYRSEAVLAPPDDMGAQNLGSLSSATLGAVASLAGISAAPGVDEVIAVMKSRQFAKSMLEDYGLIQIILSEEWDPTRKEWRASSDGLLGSESAASTSEARTERALDEFRGIFRVDLDRATNFIRVSMVAEDPENARSWLLQSIDKLNRDMRRRDVDNAERTLNFLKRRIDQEPNVELRASMVDLYQQQLRTVMLAEARPEYGVKIIDPPFVPGRTVAPRLAVTLAAFMVLALALASAGVVVYSAFRRV
jgi:uncharacterized protein involved in exopolysaccharide biosynthesis